MSSSESHSLSKLDTVDKNDDDEDTDDDDDDESDDDDEDEDKVLAGCFSMCGLTPCSPKLASVSSSST